MERKTKAKSKRARITTKRKRRTIESRRTKPVTPSAIVRKIAKTLPEDQ